MDLRTPLVRISRRSSHARPGTNELVKAKLIKDDDIVFVTDAYDQAANSKVGQEAFKCCEKADVLIKRILLLDF
jgi:hypothetical protein